MFDHPGRSSGAAGRHCGTHDRETPLMTPIDARTITGWSATSLARTTAGRGDVVVTFDADPDAAALKVDFDNGEIRIGGDDVKLPADGDTPMLSTLTQRLQHPVVCGLVLDGAARQAHSRWRGRVAGDVDAEVVAAAWSLDAARAHGRLIRRSPTARLFLRSSAALLFAGQEVTARGAVESLLPRVDSGVLPRWVGTRMREAADAELGVDMVDACERIWREFLELKDSDDARMLELATEWVELWRQRDGRGGGAEGAAADAGVVSGEPLSNADAGGIGDDPPTGAPGRDPAASGSTDFHTNGPGIGRGFTDVLDEVLDALAAEAQAAVTAESHRTTTRKPTPEEQENQAQRDLCAEIARTVFDPAALRRLHYRPPTTEDVAQRAAIVRRLERAQYAAPRTVIEFVGYPAGRPRTGSLVQRAAQRAQGQVVTATPWRRTRRRVSQKPPIHAGIVVDHSGSMSAWMPSAGTAMWALAEAVAELGGSAAAAGFAGRVIPLLKPRSRPALVPTVPGGGGSSGCAEAMAAVTAAAELTVPFGARVLVVLTDGQLPGGDSAAINAQVRYLHRHGVTVVWALTGATEHAHVIPPHVALVDEVTPKMFAALVSDTLATALEAAHGKGR